MPVSCFIRSSLFTWRDQRVHGLALLGRWGRFLVMQIGALLLNQGIYLITLHWLSPLPASMVGSAMVTSLNYVLNHRFIFH
jgi:putative flippase GtrA